jgi:hypothetical protein
LKKGIIRPQIERSLSKIAHFAKSMERWKITPVSLFASIGMGKTAQQSQLMHGSKDWKKQKPSVGERFLKPHA